MDLTKTVNFNHILIIDLLSDDDFQTARRLDDNLSAFIPAHQRTHIKIHSKEKLLEVLEQIKLKEIPKGMRPIIHIEGHGSEQLLFLPDDSSITWAELYEILKDINILLNNKLILFIATCHGFHYINTLNLLKSTPTFFLISPSKIIDPVTIEIGASIFYASLFKTKDIDNSVKKLTTYNPFFESYNSDQFFINLMVNYFNDGHYGKPARERVERLLSESFVIDESEGAIISRFERRVILSKRRKLAKTFIRSENSKFDIYKRHSLKFLGNYDKKIFYIIIKEIELGLKKQK